MMMIAAASGTIPAPFATDNTSSKTKNQNDSDFSALLFLILGLAPLQNMTAQNQQPEGTAQSDSIPAEVPNPAAPLIQGNVPLAQGSPDKTNFAPASVASVPGQPIAVGVETGNQPAASQDSPNLLMAERQEGTAVVNPAAVSVAQDLPVPTASAGTAANAPAAVLPSLTENSSSTVAAPLPNTAEQTTFSTAPQQAAPNISDRSSGAVIQIAPVLDPKGTVQTIPIVGSGSSPKVAASVEDVHSGSSAGSASEIEHNSSVTANNATGSVNPKPPQMESFPTIRNGTENAAQRTVDTTAPAPERESRPATDTAAASIPIVNAAAAQPRPVTEAPKSPESAASVIQQVAGEIATNFRQNRHEAVLTLNPPDLGRVRINLSLDGGKLEVHIVAEAHESRNLLQSHIPELKQALQAHQLDLAEVRFDNGANWSGSMGDLNQRFDRAPNGWQESRSSAGAGQVKTEVPDAPARTDAPSRDGRVSMWA